MRWGALSGFVVLGIVGCNGPGPEPGTAPSAAEGAPVVTAQVAWPAVTDVGKAAFEALSAEAAARVKASSVPVLLPPKKEWLATAGIATKPTWTTASMRADGVTVVVTASRAARQVPGVEPVKGNVAIRGSLGFVTRNEGIWGVAWMENNVAYSVEVECDQGGHPWCGDEAFVMGVAGGLVMVGGGEGGGKEGAR